MPDIASLGLKIDSSQATAAAKELDKLTVAGATAERGAQMLGASFKTSGVQAADLLNNTNLSAAARERLAAQLEKQGVATNAVTAASSKLAKGQTTATQGALGLLGASGALREEHHKGTDAVTRFADTLTRRFILGFAIAQVRGLAAGIAGLNAEMARMGDIGKLTGMGSGMTQGIMSAAGAKGIDFATMSGAMVAFNQQIPLAKAGVGTLGELLRGNKITIDDTGSAFFKFADLVKNAADGTARQSLLLQAGLPATLEMVALFKQGSAALKDQIADAEKLTDAQIVAAQKIRDGWEKGWQKFKDSGTVAVAGIMGELGALVAWWQNKAGSMAGPLELLKFNMNNGGGTRLSQTDANAFYSATGAGSGGSGGAGKVARDFATEKAIAADRIAKATTRVGLYGQTPTAQAVKQTTEPKSESNSDSNQSRLRKAP